MPVTIWLPNISPTIIKLYNLKNMIIDRCSFVKLGTDTGKIRAFWGCKYPNCHHFHPRVSMIRKGSAHRSSTKWKRLWRTATQVQTLLTKIATCHLQGTPALFFFARKGKLLSSSTKIYSTFESLLCLGWEHLGMSFDKLRTQKNIKKPWKLLIFDMVVFSHPP